MKTLYFTIKYAIKTHDKILEISSGRAGIRDIGLLESVIEHVKNDDYYPDFYSKLTHIIYSVAMNHAFHDGNKRSAIALGSLFLNINGYSKKVGTFILEMEDVIVWVADGKVKKNLLLEIITNLIEDESLSEEVKKKIFESIK